MRDGSGGDGTGAARERFFFHTALVSSQTQVPRFSFSRKIKESRGESNEIDIGPGLVETLDDGDI
jgi:hypothetical protein